VIVGNVSIFNEAQFVHRSRQLDLLARGDYSPIKDELALAYPNSDLPVRAIPFVQRYIAELSGLYARPVVRRFRPSGQDQAVYSKLQAVYRASRIDRTLSVVEDALWAQNTVLLAVLPDGIGKVHVVPILPWQVEQVDIDDPLAAHDPRSWSRIVVAVPASVAAGQVVMGRMTLSTTHAFRHVGGSKVGIYSEDGSHPFGTVPIIAIHRVQPDPGRWCSPVNEAVLNLQISLSLQAADDENIVRHCAYPQKVIKNAIVNQLVEHLTVGPDKIMTLIRGGNPEDPAPELVIVQGQVPVSELVSFAEHKIRLYCAMLGLDPSAFLRVNTSVTASARMFAHQDRQGLREKIYPCLADMENSLAKWVTAVLAIREPMAIPADLGAVVTFMVPQPSADPRAEAEASRTRLALGLASPAELLAKERGISITEATKIVKKNLEDAHALGLIATPPPTQGGTP